MITEIDFFTILAIVLWGILFSYFLYTFFFSDDSTKY